MRIIVFGASGGVGKELVQQALAAGHEVTAFVRDSNRLPFQHAKLNIVQGDGLDRDAVIHAIKGHDAVACCVGGSGLGRTSLMSEIAKHLAEGMTKHELNRIVYVASAGIHKELKGIIGGLIGFALRHVLADHRKAYELLRDRDNQLSWTVARPMQLTYGPRTEVYRETLNGQAPQGQKISRADVAHFLLKALSNEMYTNQSVGLAY
ncbi:hypothetical protein D3C78_692790 [compost metagenome]